MVCMPCWLGSSLISSGMDCNPLLDWVYSSRRTSKLFIWLTKYYILEKIIKEVTSFLCKTKQALFMVVNVSKNGIMEWILKKEEWHVSKRKKCLKSRRIGIRFKEPLKTYTYTRRSSGLSSLPRNHALWDGPCRPIAIKENIPWMVLGNASNIIVREGGIRGLSSCAMQLSNVSVDGCHREAESWSPDLRTTLPPS